MGDQTERDADERERDQIFERLEQQEMQLERIKNTIKGVADEIGGLSVDGQCNSCGQSLLLVRDGQLFCPHCKDGKTL